MRLRIPLALKNSVFPALLCLFWASASGFNLAGSGLAGKIFVAVQIKVHASVSVLKADLPCTPYLTNAPFTSATVECDEPLPFVPPIFANDCHPFLDVQLDSNDVATSCGFVRVRTWTATNNEGNSAIFVQTVTVTDTTPPAISIIAPGMTNVQDGDTLVVNCHQVISLSAGDAVAVDNCCPNTTVEFYEFVTAGNCLSDGYLQLMTCGWEATDCCGNVDSLFFTVIVVDTRVPNLLGVPANTTLPCGAPLPPVPNVSASDFCTDDLVVAFSETFQSDACLGRVVRTWTATDDCDNTATASQIIDYVDDTPPILSAVPADLTVECAWVETVPPTVTASDDCSATPTVSVSLDTVDMACGYQIIRIWAATDACGNVALDSQLIRVTDTVAPIFSGLPANSMSITCGQAIPPAPTVTATDGCDGALPVSFSQTQTGSGCNLVVTRTWTATDACGNLTVFTQTIQLEENDEPLVIEGVLPNYTVDCSSIPDLPNVTASGGCGLQVSLDFEQSQSSGCPYEITRTWTATDGCGDTLVVTQIITVSDSAPPVLHNVPANISSSCGSLPPVPNNVFATDTCDANVPVAFQETSSGSGCNLTVTRTWTATDDCGNTASQSQIIVLSDSAPPVLHNVPANISSSCGLLPPVPNNIFATDTCDANVPVAFQETSSGSGCNLTVTRTWTATDDCGNTASQSQIIVLSDSAPPVLHNVPANISSSCGSLPPVPNNVFATDSCDTNVPVAFQETSSGSGCNLTVTRTWTATDDCGNTASQSQVIVLADNQPPSVVQPTDLNASCNNLPTAITPSFSDICDDSLSIVFDEIVGAATCGYQIRWVWTATDDCGNSTTVDQLVNVVDDQAPVLTFINPALSGLQDGDTLTLQCGGNTIFGAADAIATDDCGTGSVLFEEGLFDVGDCETDGFVVRMSCHWIAMDGCGNRDTVTIFMQIVDNTPPVFTYVPPSLSFECGDLIPPFGNAVATDECSDATLSFTTDTVSVTGGIEVTRHWLATDDCGNTQAASQTYFISNVADPELVGVPNDTTIYWMDGAEVPGPANVTAFDGCDGTTPLPVDLDETVTPSPNGCDTVIVRTWSATGLGGTTVSATQIITVEGYLVFAATTTAPDTCSAGNGSASLSPDFYNYAWSDGGSGASRNDLVAGTYTVTATNGAGCTGILQLTIGAVCPCQLATVVAINTVPTVCGLAQGMADIDLAQPEADYDFVWIPNVGTANPTGNSRIDLPAGHYVVLVLFGDSTDCVEKIEFDILDDCPLVAGPIAEKLVTIAENCDLAELGYCLGIPLNEVAAYGFELNGTPFTGSFSPCAGNADSTAFMPLPVGVNTVIATRLSDGLTDTLVARVACVVSDQLALNVRLGHSDTVAVNLDELLSGLKTLSVVSEMNVLQNAYVTVVPGTNLVRAAGNHVGVTDACLLACDDYGVCDTTFLQVSVRPRKLSDLRPDLFISENGNPIIGQVLANDGLVGQADLLEILEDPTLGTAHVNTDGSITYRPDLGVCAWGGAHLEDHFTYQACVTGEGCKTAEVRVLFHCFESENARLRVFNGQGVLVHEDQNSGEWLGSHWQNSGLPAGAYFYLLETDGGIVRSGLLFTNQ